MAPSRGESIRTHLINRRGCVARDLRLVQGARRENIRMDSSTDEQRGSRRKDLQPFGLSHGGAHPLPI